MKRERETKGKRQTGGDRQRENDKERERDRETKGEREKEVCKLYSEYLMKLGLFLMHLYFV